ncbi:MAG: hypothetical protein IGR92_14380 [Leptolyngbyaceae cyanobacterium T60_A2020_046]|nr:hypothetical protein [Leptolyngbyaceae cyanobacterium T60_A2020_046]
MAQAFFRAHPGAIASLAPHRFQQSLGLARHHWAIGDWVTLAELPSPYSHHEALLLCQDGEEGWLAWVPEHGEVRLPL